jgi:hypothetical protein
MLKPEPSISEPTTAYSSQMRDHDDHVAAVEKLTLALMFTPEVEIVTLFLLTFRNISAGNLST